MADIAEHFLLYRVNDAFITGGCGVLSEAGYHIQGGELKVSHTPLMTCAQAGQIFLDGTQMFFSLHDPDPQMTGFICVDSHIIQNVIRWQVCRLQHKASLRAAVPGKYVFCY